MITEHGQFKGVVKLSKDDTKLFGEALARYGWQSSSNVIKHLILQWSEQVITHKPGVKLPYFKIQVQFPDDNALPPARFTFSFGE